MAKKRKVRVDLRKNRSKPPRKHGWTRGFHSHGYSEEDGPAQQERVQAKGDLSRRRTIITEQHTDQPALAAMPAVDTKECLPGRVLRVQGLLSVVAAEDGRRFRCSLRRVLRNLVIDERSIVAAGDQVWVRPAGGDEGVIERVEPRHGLITRASRGKEHILVANVDQVVIVSSLGEPAPKPHLIDRYLVSAEQGQVAPILCLNKVDLVNAADHQPLIGLYSQLGVTVVLTSVADGRGIARLREVLVNRQTVFAGQSGVGKSSLLNAIQPGLNLKIREVSEATEKGRHTTTTAELIPLDFGGWVVDTPGIRQFALWKVHPGELEGLFLEFRPYVQHCRMPGCTHRHEVNCAIKEAVRTHRIALQRYESFVGLFDEKPS